MGCSTDKVFDSRMVYYGPFATEVDNSAIKNEPMFFSSDLYYAYSKGGPITRAFIEALPDEWENAVFDSRVHMLMPGWFPSIPGFHHDDVPRPRAPLGQHFGAAGQPDYDNPRYHSRHISGLVNAAVAPTQFVIGECPVSAVDDDDIIYRKWHLEVQALIDAGEVQTVSAPDRRLIYFDCDAFHRGTEAVASGWRWFGRVSIDTERADQFANEIRRQAQVYMGVPMQGW